MPPEDDQPLNNDVQIAPSVDNVIDPSVVVEAPKVEGADTFAAFEAAQKAAEAAGEPDLFKAPDKVDKPAEAASDSSKEGEPAKADAPKADAPKKSAQERIAELSRRKGDAERAAEAKEVENRELRARIEALERGERPATEVSDEPAAPAPDDKNDDGTEKYPFGELDTKYVKDLARHEALQTVREERTREAQTRQEQAAREAAEAQEHAFVDQLEAAVKEIPDYAEKVLDGAAAGKWPLNREVDALIRDSEVGAKVAYHLATNLREAVALDKITDPVERARSFGRLEALVQTSTKPPAKSVKTPTAEAPIPSARGTNGQFTGTPSDFKSFEAKFQPVLDAANR